MPELPEVHTTATILNKLIKGRTIKFVWSDYNSAYYKGKETIKDPAYFAKFKKAVTGKKALRVWRRAKNVLIDIEGDQTILVHMKMTGHLLYGSYSYNARRDWKWFSEEKHLNDPFNRFVHLVFELDNGKHVAFSDMRKFATVKLISDKKALAKEFSQTGPEPLDPKFDWRELKRVVLQKPNGKIKTVLMDVGVIAGIGNIYSDEILWNTKINPERRASKISDAEFKSILKFTKQLLTKGIDFGGDSMSDYRNPYGMKGKFQAHHQVYQRKNEKCLRRGCDGVIKRIVVGARSAHFCPACQR